MVNFSHSLYLLVARSLPFSRIPFSSFYPHFTFSSLRSQKIVRIKTFGGCKLKWDNRETGKATRSIRKFSRVSRFSHSRSENDTWFSGYIYIVRIISVSTHVCICSCMYAYTCYDRWSKEYARPSIQLVCLHFRYKRTQIERVLTHLPFSQCFPSTILLPLSFAIPYF